MRSGTPSIGLWCVRKWGDSGGGSKPRVLRGSLLVYAYVCMHACMRVCVCVNACAHMRKFCEELGDLGRQCLCICVLCISTKLTS